MPVYKIETPDGRKIKVEADTPEKAVEGARAYVAANPAGPAPDRVAPGGSESLISGAPRKGGTPAQQRAAADARRRSATTPGQVRAFTQGASLGFVDELDAASAALETGAHNLFARTGLVKPAGYGMREAYNAVMDSEQEAKGRFYDEHPVQAVGLELAGGVAAPGSVAAGKYVAGAPTLLKGAGRSAAVGAGYGAAAGAGNGRGVEGRAKGAVFGAGTGAVVGAALPPAASAAKSALRTAPRLVAGGEEALLRVGKAVGYEPKPAKITPKTTQRAAQVVREIAERRGMDPRAIDIAIAGYSRKPVTGAEVLGREAQTLLMALGRRSGRTGDELGELLRGRTEAAPARVVDDLRLATGRRPEQMFDDFEKTKMAMWEAAEPEYQRAYQFGPVGSEKIDQLLTRPIVREAMARAYRVARNRGEDPETLGLVNADVMDDWLNYVPQVDQDLERASKILDRRWSAPSERAGRGKTMLEYIAENGRILDDGGELAAMDADRWHLDRPYRPRLIADGQGTMLRGPKPDTADGWAQRLHERGYFPEVPQDSRPTPNDLYEAIREELAGKPRYARSIDPRVADRLRMLDEAESILARGGDDVPTPDQYGGFSGHPDEAIDFLDHVEDPVTRVEGRPEPRTEPAYRYQPTLQSLDLMKRAMDDVIEKARNPITGKLELDDELRAVIQANNELKNELVRLTTRPDGSSVYQEALYRGGDAPRLETAWRDGPKLFSNEVAERVFADRWSKMNKADRQAATGSMLDDLFTRARTGRLNLKSFKTPAMRSKLITALGREKASWFMAQLDKELQLAAGSRMSPTANSPTAEITQANKDLDRGTGFLADLEQRIEGGQNPVAAGGAALARTAFSPVAGFLRGMQSPYRQGVRDEIGRMLMDPDALQEALRSAPVRDRRFPAGYVAPGAAIVAGDAAAPEPSVSVMVEGRPELGVGNSYLKKAPRKRPASKDAH